MVVEKAPQVGGLATTLVYERPDGTYRTDIGPHRFFSKNAYLYQFLEDLLEEDWIKVPRLTRFLVDGKFYLYPIQMGNVLRQIGPWKAFRVLTDYLAERVRQVVAPRSIRSFEDYVLRQFGRTLGEFNMLNYTEKIWGIPCREISVDWANQRIGGLSIWSVLKKALFRASGPKTLVDEFYYPSLGSGLIYQRIRERLEAQGSTVLTQSTVQRIDHANGRVRQVTLATPDGERVLAPEHVVSSVPITEAVKLFHPLPPEAVLRAAEGLRFRSQVYLFLTVDQERISRDNWIYFPDKEIPFGRISEMKNFSDRMCPPGKTSLFVEFFCFQGDSIWTMDKDALFALTMDWLEKLHLLDRRHVTSVEHLRRTHVYPLYDLHYHDRVQTVLQWMDGLQNFTAIGRPGRFRYTNQDHSLEMGILAAQTVLDGRRRNVDEVGAEREYFEKGYVQSAKSAA